MLWSSAVVMRTQATNYASFMLGYTRELKDELRQDLPQAKAELAGTKKAHAKELMSPRVAAVCEI
jgi:hypothetical protein